MLSHLNLLWCQHLCLCQNSQLCCFSLPLLAPCQSPSYVKQFPVRGLWSHSLVHERCTTIVLSFLIHFEQVLATLAQDFLNFGWRVLDVTRRSSRALNQQFGLGDSCQPFNAMRISLIRPPRNFSSINLYMYPLMVPVPMPTSSLKIEINCIIAKTDKQTHIVSRKSAFYKSVSKGVFIGFGRV